MRKKIIEEMIKEVYGPREGSEEILYSDPWKEYITGVIIPYKWKIKEWNQDPDSEIIGSEEFGTSEEDSNNMEVIPNIPSELDPKMRPKSFGISFVSKEQPSFDVCVTWGRYTERKYDEKKTCWIRKPNYKILKIDNNEDKKILYNGKDGQLYLKIRRVKWKNNSLNITVSLVNDLNPGTDFKPLISSCIFQPSIRIKLHGDAKVIDPNAQINCKEKLHYLYRNKPTKARGHMCSAIWKEIDYMNGEILDNSILWPDGIHFNEECIQFLEPDLRTEFVPLYPIPAPSFDLDEKYGGTTDLSAYKLSENWNVDDIDRTLLPIAKAYESWIQVNKQIIDNSTEAPETSAEIINDQERALKRINKGIEIIKKDIYARLAFCFANRTIYLQNRWGNGKKEFKWRPFQLAFFLLNLESICDKNSGDRDTLDLLWIPTGGGKTEAYMGIMAFTIALRRIRSSEMSYNKTGAGTSIISRYTLRILTVQQFRRTLKMITAAEYLRTEKVNGKIGWRPKKCDLDDTWIYGSARFSAGMWVGGAVSPNHLRNKGKGAMDSLMGKKGVNGEPAQVVKCPVCGSFLSLSDSGLPKGFNKLHIVVKGCKDTEKMKTKVSKLKDSLKTVKDITVSTKNHKNNFMTLTLNLYSDSEIGINKIEKIWKELSQHLKVKLASLDLRNLGYFGSVLENGRKKQKFSDFEIWCPNPDCELNNKISWNEGVPLSSSDLEFPDGLFERDFISPFDKHRMPIPAYTVDEQIYSKCPTIVICTADKIARLSFEPRAASLFGIIDKYNQVYGYHRDDLYPKDHIKACLNSEIPVERFSPPDLIVQDELHLIDGPLGSMFGLYEAIVDGIIKIAGGNPKYIASTATIKNAESQVKLLFDKSLSQFPPYGLEIDDSFFIRETSFKQGWNKNQPGRIYMGIYAPGMGPMTPPIRIWSRSLKTPYDNFESDELKYFWTVTGYYNAIRELGGGRALYREDIEERLNEISKENVRNLDQEMVVELSSRIDSTNVPQVLSELENDGIINSEQKHPSKDAIFTTSMFGTGVDIPHLSFLIVNGQPKTTGSYIQATGRIGRTHGGLVITFLRAGRPRDLSHYEMFCSYHQRIHMGVEPVSVSPFSTGALWKAMGPSAVAFLRNIPNTKVKWSNSNGKDILIDKNDSDISHLIDILKSRLESLNDKKCDYVMNYLYHEIDKWKNAAKSVDNIEFSEYPWRKPKKNVVLGSPAHKYYEKQVVYENAPQSLREIEETTGFRV